MRNATQGPLKTIMMVFWWYKPKVITFKNRTADLLFLLEK